MAEFWDRSATLGEIVKSDAQKIVVSEVEKADKAYIDIRNYYRKDGEWLPGKGISVPQEHASELHRILSGE